MENGCQMANIYNPSTNNITISTSGYSSVTSSSSTYTLSGTASNWASPNTNFYSSNQKAIMTIPHGEEKIVLEKTATLEVKGNVVINGIDLEERLNIIEKLLHIPERDVIMEAKYPSLKKKFDDYINTLEKYRTFERIKGDDNGTT